MGSYPGGMKAAGAVCMGCGVVIAVGATCGALCAVCVLNPTMATAFATIAGGAVGAAGGSGITWGGAKLIEKGYEIENNQREKDLSYEERKREMERKWK